MYIYIYNIILYIGENTRPFMVAQENQPNLPIHCSLRRVVIQSSHVHHVTTSPRSP